MIIIKNIKDEEVVDIVKKHCPQLKQIKNKKNIIINKHRYDDSFNEVLFIKRNKNTWDVHYHFPCALSNLITIDENFSIIKSSNLLNENQTPTIPLCSMHLSI